MDLKDGKTVYIVALTDKASSRTLENAWKVAKLGSEGGEILTWEFQYLRWKCCLLAMLFLMQNI